MSINALQEYIFVTKYARRNEEKKRRETYEESVDRVLTMYEKKFAGMGVENEIEFCRAAMKEKLVLGSQRALQFGGAPIEKKNARMYNCTTSYCDRPRFFQECLWLLLCGCGTGFSVQKHHVANLPPLEEPNRSLPVAKFLIPDTIEGWGDSLGVLLASYGIAAPEFADWQGLNVEIDYSAIRPKGAVLSSGSGKAPGPDPLRGALDEVRKLLDRCLNAGQTHLRSIDAYDIVMHASDAVLSGGVRRSATICLFSVDDQDMITAKTGDWFIKNAQRGRSNNSAVLLRDTTSRETFAQIMKSTRECGEPGFVWSDSTEIMYNPCVEIGLYPTITEKDFCEITGFVPIPVARLVSSEITNGGGSVAGATCEGRALDALISGWAFCNLCEINAKKCTDYETWKRAATAAAILGTFQCSYTSFSYLGPVSEAIARREALLGVSMTGIMDNPSIVLDPQMQRSIAAHILSVNEALAPKIGVRLTARATCVKPAGTTSCILGTSSGIHPHHAPRYFRRAQGNELEAPLQYYALHNPKHVEMSVWSKNKTDKSVIFCVETVTGAHTKETVSALQLLEFVKLTQLNWVDGGRVLDRCAAPFLRHNVSNTINIKPDEWDAVEQFIFDNRAYFAGISLLSHAGDRDYPQAPFCQVFTPLEQTKMYGDGQPMASGLIVDGLAAFNNNLWTACDCALGIGENLSGNYDGSLSLEQIQAEHKTRTLKRDWVRRAKKFAENYFGGDVKKMTYCLKDVNNWKLWCDLKRVYQPVDWSLFFEETDTLEDVTLDAACAGGACEILSK